jgi:hypothetical protein
MSARLQEGFAAQRDGERGLRIRKKRRKRTWMLFQRRRGPQIVTFPSSILRLMYLGTWIEIWLKGL